jgi:CIC family chloride channel protein
MEEEREESELTLEDAMEPVQVPVLQGSNSIYAIATTDSMKQTIANAPAILVECSNGWYAARKDELEKLLAEFGGDPERAEAHRALEAFLGKERTPLVFPFLPALAGAAGFESRIARQARGHRFA